MYSASAAASAFSFAAAAFAIAFCAAASAFSAAFAAASALPAASTATLTSFTFSAALVYSSTDGYSDAESSVDFASTSGSFFSSDIKIY